ncbi:MAG: hypothetical protein R3E64_18045 [Halioglobus sp.]
MLIDWFTVGAQALNFVILVWLLKRFLYKPILDAIDAREQKIAAQLADAQAKKAEAKQEREEFQRKINDLDQRRAQLLKQASDDASTEGRRMLDAARQAADNLSARRQETLRNDANNLNQAIERKTRQEVFAIARKALTDLAGASLEQRISEVFIERLRALTGEDREGLGKALKAARTPTLVRSGFDLSQEQRDAIHTAVNETFSADIPLRFEVAPDLVCGIELATEGQKLSWSVDQYLRSLEQAVAELLKPDIDMQPQPETKPKAEHA